MAALALLLAAPIAAAISLDMQPDAEAYFDKYTSDFDKVYAKGSADYKRRLMLFQSRVQSIEAHNSKTDRRWTAGVNRLTDQTEEELAQLRGYRPGPPSTKSSAVLLDTTVNTPLDESVDWRHLSLNGSTLDQGGCGSCWAVATSVMLQARYEAKTGKTRTFSAQQLVNCVENPHECGGQGGCKGATVELAMDYIQNNPNGLSDLNSVGYTGADGTCRDDQKYIKPPSASSSFLSTRAHNNKAFEQFGLTNWVKLADNKAEPLMRALTDGPVAISVGASGWSSYRSGIFDGCSKDATIDHAVVLFGYGKEGNTPYWLIRNSWGKSWGEKGYVRLLRQDTADAEDSHCGTDYKPGDGVACKPYPKTSPVCGMCGLLFDSVTAHFINA